VFRSLGFALTSSAAALALGCLLSLIGCMGNPERTGGGLSGYGPEGGLIDFDVYAIPDPDDAGGTDGSGVDANSARDARPVTSTTDGGQTDTGTGTGTGTADAGSCTGVTTSCAGRLGTCISSLGCFTTGNCTGVSQDCFYQIGSITCIDIQGCYWDSLSNSCSGVSLSCGSFSGLYTCDGQPGCSWQTGCDGVATPCSLLSEADCALQPGCLWH
jgi:hypothetical protein